ncbi:MAG: WYL domain-containing protein [Blastocatellia bacterium]|nr:WYL domain-containing protein [Blastocatellia bacterium]
MASAKQSNFASRRVHLHAYARLQTIVTAIQRGRFPNKPELARVIERNQRTVQRDLEQLRSTWQAPLEFDRARNGFYFTDPKWKLPDLKLTEGELIYFFTAERILRRLSATSEVQMTRQALRKLATLLPDEIVIDTSALEQSITFAPEPILDAAPETLRALATAATNRETLHIRYYTASRDEHNERDVDVLLLHNHLGEWYAVCRDHKSGQIKDFHAGRISAFSHTRRKFALPDDWNPKEYLERGFGMFRGGQDVTVTIEFDAYQARYARERTFHPTQTQTPLQGGGLRITFETTENALEQVARWLLQYGEHAEAKAPQRLRAMMKERLTNTGKLYE